MRLVNQLALIVVCGVVLCLVVYVWRRARRGYVTVQQLMAQVEAHAAADAAAQASAQNRVDVRVGGVGDDATRVIAELGDQMAELRQAFVQYIAAERGGPVTGNYRAQTQLESESKERTT